MINAEIKNWLTNPKNKGFYIDNRKCSEHLDIDDRNGEFEPEMFSGFTKLIRDYISYLAIRNIPQDKYIKLYNTFTFYHNIEGSPGTLVNKNNMLEKIGNGDHFNILSVYITDTHNCGSNWYICMSEADSVLPTMVCNMVIYEGETLNIRVNYIL